MRIFKMRPFDRWMRCVCLSDGALIQVVEEIKQGLYEAALGGHLYKKRIRINNKGKSGGLRTLLAFKMNDKAFFIHGFSKSEQENIDTQQLEICKNAAKALFSLTPMQIENALRKGALIEVRI